MSVRWDIGEKNLPWLVFCSKARQRQDFWATRELPFWADANVFRDGRDAAARCDLSVILSAIQMEARWPQYRGVNSGLYSGSKLELQ